LFLAPLSVPLLLLGHAHYIRPPISRTKKINTILYIFPYLLVRSAMAKSFTLSRPNAGIVLAVPDNASPRSTLPAPVLQIAPLKVIPVVPYTLAMFLVNRKATHEETTAKSEGNSRTPGAYRLKIRYFALVTKCSLVPNQ
jgi:hypothetical protein